MLNIIILSIIGAAIIIIIVVVLRKFPVAANLDLDQLAEEQEVKKKRLLINRRLGERGREAQDNLRQRFAFLKRFWGVLQLKFRVYVGKIEKLLHYEELLKNREKSKQIPYSEKERQLNEFLIQAGNQFGLNNYDKAEEFYISAIKLDKKSAPAYRGLAETYVAKGSMEEALQTYDFLSRLFKDDDDLLVKLSEISEELGKLDQAIGYMERATVVNDSLAPRFLRLAELYTKLGQPNLALDAISQAVELEPKSPKYLDFLLETAILCGNRALAGKTFEELRLVNPENQKLAELKERVEKM